MAKITILPGIVQQFETADQTELNELKAQVDGIEILAKASLYMNESILQGSGSGPLIFSTKVAGLTNGLVTQATYIADDGAHWPFQPSTDQDVLTLSIFTRHQHTKASTVLVTINGDEIQPITTTYTFNVRDGEYAWLEFGYEGGQVVYEVVSGYDPGVN